MPHSMSKKTPKIKKKQKWKRRSVCGLDVLQISLQLRASLKQEASPPPGSQACWTPLLFLIPPHTVEVWGSPHGHLASPPLLSSPSQRGRRSSDRRWLSCSWTLLLHPLKSFSSPQHPSTGDVKSACECPHWQNPVPGGPGALSRTDSPAEPGKQGCRGVFGLQQG